MTVRRAALGAAAAALAVGAGACGDNERQDANEPSGTYEVEVVKATFPAEQRLAENAKFVIAVKNTGGEAVPNVAVTIGNGDAEAPAQAFAEQIDQAGVADPSRPIWVIDEGPGGGTGGVGADTAYVNTWTLGRLAPGATRTFVWEVTALRPGTHSVLWRVGAGLNGKAKARLAGGAIPEGSFTVQISQRVPKSTVGPDGEVLKDVTEPDGTNVEETG